MNTHISSALRRRFSLVPVRAAALVGLRRSAARTDHGRSVSGLDRKNLNVLTTASQGLSRRSLRTAILGVLSASILLVSPAIAGAAERALPAPSKYNTAPSCPVSADHPVCGPWNVPVDQSNPFGADDYGQCPYWAVELRPDVFQNSQDHVTISWAGGEAWVTNAQKEGLAVDGSPQVGDIAVWSEAQANASGSTGHVAYVAAVNSDGSIVITEMNRFANQGDTAWVPRTPVADGGWQGLQFIHRTYTPPSHTGSGNGSGHSASGPQAPHLKLVSKRHFGAMISVVVSVAPGARGKLTLYVANRSYRSKQSTDPQWHYFMLYPAGHHTARVKFKGQGSWRSQTLTVKL